MRTGVFQWLFLIVALSCGCGTVPSLPLADLRTSGWSVRQGQAVWTPARGADGLAGELLLAIRPDGSCFVQFAKPPFNLVTARAEPEGWFLEVASTRRTHGGRGLAPGRVVWFALADGLRGNRLAGEWVYQGREAGGWCLTNRVSGEALEGYFGP